jgi:hypothetical protein
MIDDRIPITYQEVCKRLGAERGVSIPRKIKRKGWLGETRYWAWSVEDYIAESWGASLRERKLESAELEGKPVIGLKSIGGTLSHKECELEQRIQKIEN